MRKFNRGIAAGVLSLPLALGLGGIASAEGTSYDGGAATAGPEGASSQQVNSQADENGNASFNQQNSSADENGASSQHTGSNTADSHDNGGLLGVLGL